MQGRRLHHITVRETERAIWYDKQKLLQMVEESAATVYICILCIKPDEIIHF